MNSEEYQELIDGLVIALRKKNTNIAALYQATLVTIPDDTEITDIIGVGIQLILKGTRQTADVAQDDAMFPLITRACADILIYTADHNEMVAKEELINDKVN